VDSHRGMSSALRGVVSGKQSGHEHDPHVLVFGAALALDREATAAPDGLPWVVMSCSDHRALLEAMIERHSDAVVFELRAGCPQDLGVLHLVRRALPHIPLIVVADDDSLDLQRRVQALKPTYYAVRPLESAEIVEALTDALARRSIHRH
jgi:DNA-binding NarL/FixJ family response regulator